MLQMVKLFLPVVFPSWRFFSAIGPSPRIEYVFTDSASRELVEQNWQPLVLLPAQLTWRQALWRFVFNAQWNELLYLNTCAEHLFEGYSDFFDQEIGLRLCAKIANGELHAPQAATYLVYRLRAVHAYESQPSDKTPPRDEITFTSQPFLIAPASAFNGDN